MMVDRSSFCPSTIRSCGLNGGKRGMIAIYSLSLFCGVVQCVSMLFCVDEQLIYH